MQPSTLSNPFADRASYRADIDGLRAIAVLAVVFYHAGFSGFSGGYLGVDVFFVISGYLITGGIWKELREGHFSLVDFYARRVKRIFPALFLVLVASSFAALFLLIPTDMAAFGKSVKAAAFFYSNFHFSKVDYFDAPAIDKQLLHTWSLSVEEQFYAFWPLLLIVFLRLLPNRGVIWAVIAVASVSLLLYEIRLYSGYPKDAFYVSYTRVWELIAGAALAISPFALKSSRLAAIAVGLGATVIVAAIASFSAELRFPGLGLLLACAGAVLVVGAGRTPNGVSTLLGCWPLRFIGLISYSLYLIHWPLLSFTRIWQDAPLTLDQRVLIVIASIALAYLSWRFVETPFRRIKMPSRRVLLRAVPAAAAVWTFGLAATFDQGLKFRVSKAVLEADLAVGAWRTLRGYTPQHDQPSPPLCKSVEFVFKDKTLACEIGPNDRPYTFLVWGDSHAQHYVAAIATVAKSYRAHGFVVTRPGCAPFLDDSTISQACRAFNTSVANWIEEHPTLRFAIVASRWTHHQTEIRAALDRPEADHGAFAKTMALFQAQRIVPVILEQVPEFNEDARRCLARANMHKRPIERCVVQERRVEQARRVLSDAYFKHIKVRNGAINVSPLPALCDDTSCYAYRDATLLYVDSNHLSFEGSLYLAHRLGLERLFARAEVSLGDGGDAGTGTKTP